MDLISKATPGLWRAHSDSVINEHGVIVATTSGRFLQDYEERRAESHTNATLMAAAKELYEALLVISVGPLNEGGLMLAKAALKKAEGVKNG